ncbi:MAG: hypothetical protein ACAI35_06890 [Candidatus Methylacidiphilales bacterium]|nr:hypothetical protein [Candidatus Methylacidiphilales bacterium]
MNSTLTAQSAFCTIGKGYYSFGFENDDEGSSQYLIFSRSRELTIEDVEDDIWDTFYMEWNTPDTFLFGGFTSIELYQEELVVRVDRFAASQIHANEITVIFDKKIPLLDKIAYALHACAPHAFKDKRDTPPQRKRAEATVE